MPRSIWKGAVSFGMISIPVKLFGATENKDIAFRQLHEECGGRLKQQRRGDSCERRVEFSGLQKGYEYAKEQHVVLTDEDFAKLPLPASTRSSSPPSSRQRRSTPSITNVATI